MYVFMGPRPPEHQYVGTPRAAWAAADADADAAADADADADA